MRYHTLFDNPEPILQKRLEIFEEQFQYPLRDELKFIISHGKRYLNFYRAMGPSTSIVAENDENVQGTLCASKRQLYCLQDQSKKEIYYVGDFRVDPLFQKGRLSYQLIKRLGDSLQASPFSCLSVVMDGTKVTPMQYTGRIGIPYFQAMHKLYIVQLKARTMKSSDVCEVSSKEGVSILASLARENYFTPYAPSLRAKKPCHWLTVKGKACGYFENTLLAKRLFLTDGKEIKNAHLSYFVYEDIDSASALINAALQLCFKYAYQGLFFTLLPEQYFAMINVLTQYEGSISKATLYGTADIARKVISINSAEI